MTSTPDADGWITHDGGPCPLDPAAFIEREYALSTTFGRAQDAVWREVKRYRIFAPFTPGPLPFVRETAARIMAAAVVDDDFLEAMGGCDQEHTVNATARFAVRAAQALEAALKDAAP